MAILDPRTGQTVTLPIPTKPGKPKEQAPVDGKVRRANSGER